jgi:hypothetical protein
LGALRLFIRLARFGEVYTNDVGWPPGTPKLRNLSFLGPDQMDNFLKDRT